jgi:hypothetical protein
MLEKLAFVVLTPHGRRTQRMGAGLAVRLVSAVLFISVAGYIDRTGPAAGDAASSPLAGKNSARGKSRANISPHPDRPPSRGREM